MPQNRPDPQKEVSDYLARKLGVSRAESEAMPDAIAAIVREPQAGIEALFAALNRSVPRRIEQHIQAITALVGTLVPATAERVPGTERERIESAVEEAVRLGIVRQEVFPAAEPTDRVAYLLSSAHYVSGNFDPARVPEATKASQAELIRLAYLLGQKGVRSPIRVEGRTDGMGYTPFGGHRFGVQMGHETVDLFDPRAQRYLFEHPRTLRELMDAHQRACEHSGISQPVFYEYVPNLNYKGAHTPATSRLVDDFDATWIPWHRAFTDKWKFFFDSLRTLNGRQESQIGTGWDGAGTPIMEFAGRWLFAHDVATDMGNYLRYADKLNEVNIAREAEMAALMLAEPAETVPMAFAGKAHELFVVDRLTPHAEVRVLTPMSSVPLDSKRHRLPINHPQSRILNIEMATNLRNAALSLQPRRV